MFVSVGANRIRPIFILAIFILDSADARFRFQVSSFKIQVSGVGQVCCRWANRIRTVFVFAIFILDRAKCTAHVSDVK